VLITGATFHERVKTWLGGGDDLLEQQDDIWAGGVLHGGPGLDSLIDGGGNAGELPAAQKFE